MAINEFDAGARPSAWQRVSTNPSRFGGTAASSSGILDAFSDIFARIATSDRGDSPKASDLDDSGPDDSGPDDARSADDPEPSDAAADDDRTATSAESDDESAPTRSAEPRLEFPDSLRPESARPESARSESAAVSERSAADLDEPTILPVDSGDAAPTDSAKKRSGPTQPDRLPGDLDAAGDQPPKPDANDPRIHPAVAELEPRRREQGAVPNPRPVDPEGEQGRGVERAAGQPAEATEGSRHGHDRGEGDQGGLFSEQDPHGDRRRDRRDRSADEPLAPREPSQNSRVANMKPSAGIEAEMASASAASADSPVTTASSGDPAMRASATIPASVATAEASVRGNAAKSSSSSPPTAADSVKPVDGATEGRPAADDGRPDDGRPVNSPNRTEASAGTGKGADGRDGGSEAVSRAKLVQRVSRAFHQLGGTGGIVRMRLAPAELGSVRIEMRVQDRRVDARVVAESEAAGHILRDHLPELRQRLESQGMKIERIEIQTEHESLTENGREFGRGDHQDRGHDREPPKHRHPWDRPRPDPLRSLPPVTPTKPQPPVASPLTAAGVDVRW